VTTDRKATRATPAATTSDPHTGWEKTWDRLRDSGPVAILAGIAFAGSYGHSTALAERYGQTGWKALATAGCVDLLCVIGAEERQRDKRIGRRRRFGFATWPTVVLFFGIIATLAANVATAQPSPWGFIVAGWPALALLLAVSILERRASHALAGSGTAADAATLAAAADVAPVPPAGLEPGTGTVDGSEAEPGTVSQDRPAVVRTSAARRPGPEPATRSLHSMEAIERKARQLADDHRRVHGRDITLTVLQTGLQDAGMGRSRTEVGRLRRLVLGLEEAIA
jgi:hypothetical protein